MRLKCLLVLSFFTPGWCDLAGETGDPSYRYLSSNRPGLSDFDPLTGVEDRYPYSHVEAYPVNPFKGKSKAPYPSEVSPFAAKEYGLPGLGYVLTPIDQNNYSPTLGFGQVDADTSYSIKTSEEADSQEETSATSTTPTTTTPTTTTTRRPPKPPLPPRPPPPPPPPPLPLPSHSTNAINLAPPKNSGSGGHRVPTKPPRAQKKRPQRRPGRGDLELLQDPDFGRRLEYIVEEEEDNDGFRNQLQGSSQFLSRPQPFQQQYYYSNIAPSYFPWG